MASHPSSIKDTLLKLSCSRKKNAVQLIHDDVDCLRYGILHTSFFSYNVCACLEFVEGEWFGG